MDNEIEQNKSVVSLANLLSDSIISSSHQVINGLLGTKQKLMITAPPKSCKTSLAVNLAIAMNTGNKWLDYKCIEGKILYINTDISNETLYQRFIDVCHPTSIELNQKTEKISFLSLKNGYRHNTVNDLVETILEAIGDEKYSLIIIDSLDYFVSFESNHNGSTFGPVINQALDLISHETGASIVFTLKTEYGHVFEGFTDTNVKLLPIPSEQLKKSGIELGNYYQVDIQSSVYESPKPTLFKFEYPRTHKSKKVLEENESSNIVKELDHREKINSDRKQHSKNELDKAFSELSLNGEPVEIGLIADWLGIHIKSVYRKVKNHSDYETVDGLVHLKKQ